MHTASCKDNLAVEDGDPIEDIACPEDLFLDGSLADTRAFDSYLLGTYQNVFVDGFSLAAINSLIGTKARVIWNASWLDDPNKRKQILDSPQSKAEAKRAFGFVGAVISCTCESSLWLEKELGVSVPISLERDEAVAINNCRILVGVGAGLGNIIQTTPMIRVLSEYFGVKIDVFVNSPVPGAIGLLGQAKWINNVYEGSSSVELKLYDYAYITACSGHVIPPLSSKKQFVQRRTYAMIDECGGMHETEYNFQGLTELLPDLSFTEADLTRFFVSNYSHSHESDNRTVGLCSGNKPGVWQKRNWPYFEELGQLLKEDEFKVRSFGTAEEYVNGTEDCTGTSLRDSIENMLECSCFVANDGGAFHIAEALGIPTMALFGPTSAIKNGPTSKHTMIVSSDLECAPCQWKIDNYRCDDNICMTSLSAETVFKTFQEFYSGAVSEKPARSSNNYRQAFKRERFTADLVCRKSALPHFLQESLDRYVEDVGFYAYVAQGRISAGDFERAEEIIEKAASLWPEHEELMLPRAKLFFERGQFEQARDILFDLVKVRADNISVQRFLLQTLARLEDWNKIVEIVLSQSGDISSIHDSEAAWYLGNAYIGLRDWDHAKSALNTSLALRPGLIRVVDKLRSIEMLEYIDRAVDGVVDNTPISTVCFVDSDTSTFSKYADTINDCPTELSQLFLVKHADRDAKKIADEDDSSALAPAIDSVQSLRDVFECSSGSGVLFLSQEVLASPELFYELLAKTKKGDGYCVAREHESGKVVGLYVNEPLSAFVEEGVEFHTDFKTFLRTIGGIATRKIVSIDGQYLTDTGLSEFIEDDEGLLGEAKNNRKTVFLMSRHGYPPFGGGEQFLLSLYPVYEELGFKPIIVGFQGDTSGEENGIRYISIPNTGDRIRKLIADERPGLIHTLSGSCYEMLYACTGLDIPVITGTHFWRDMVNYRDMNSLFCDFETFSEPRKDFAYILRNAKVLYSNSEYTRDLTRKNFGVHTSITFSLPHNVEKKEISPKEPGYVLLVNSKRDKGFGLLLEIAEILPGIEFKAIASQSSASEVEAELLDRKLDNIEILTWSADMGSLYSGAKVVLVPSFEFIETFSRVVIEAHRFGKPVVGSTAGNVPYLLRDSGIYLPEDPKLWADEISRLYHDDDYYLIHAELAYDNSERYSFDLQKERIKNYTRFCLDPVLVAMGGEGEKFEAELKEAHEISRVSGHCIDIILSNDSGVSLERFKGLKWLNLAYREGTPASKRDYKKVYVLPSYSGDADGFSAGEVLLV